MPSRLALILFVLAALPGQFAAQTVVHEAGEPGLEPPRVVQDSQVQPVYPEEALRDGVQGTVLLRVVVSEYGLVDSVEIFRSPFGGESLAQSAVAAVRQWRYHPAQLQGRAVACRIMQTIPFHPPSTKAPETRRRRGRRNREAGKSAEAVHGEPSKAAPPATPVAAEGKPAPATPPPGSVAAEEKPAAPVRPVTAREDPAAASPPHQSGDAPPPSPSEVSGTAPVPPSRPPEPAHPPESEPKPAKPPVARPVAPPVIDINSGGPRGLLLGQPGSKLRTFLGDAGQEGDVLRLAELGMEITVADSPRGEQIVAIRYVFTDVDGLSASGLRTRKGLGYGSFCMGIIPAYGRPDHRRESSEEDVDGDLTLEYLREGSLSRFLCRDGRLAELILELQPRP